MRKATVARLALGGVCLAVPGAVLGAISAPDRRERRVRGLTRVLGLRMVAQAALDLVPVRPVRDLDVAVELAHATSMVPVAVLRPFHRRSASVSAALATGIAALDLVESRG